MTEENNIDKLCKDGELKWGKQMKKMDNLYRLVSCSMSKNNGECGRSMVEMLGVLAIIGILSITGIYGYTIAMRKYRANEIVQAASILAVMAQSANSGEGECIKLSDIGFLSNVAGLDVRMVAKPTPSNPPIEIVIDVEGLESNDPLYDMIGNAADGNRLYTFTYNGEITCDE